MKEGFGREIAKIVIDRLLIGVVLVVLGFLANRTIEKFKSEQTFVEELNKLRVQKIAEVWEKVYVFEATAEPMFKAREMTSDQIEEFMQGPLSEKKMKVYRQKDADAVAPFEHAKQEALDLANRNRLWIGEDQYAAIRAYIDASEEYSFALHSITADKEAVEALRKKREEKRATIVQIRSALLKE